MKNLFQHGINEQTTRISVLFTTMRYARGSFEKTHYHTMNSTIVPIIIWSYHLYDDFSPATTRIAFVRAECAHHKCLPCLLKINKQPTINVHWWVDRTMTTTTTSTNRQTKQQSTQACSSRFHTVFVFLICGLHSIWYYYIILVLWFHSHPSSNDWLRLKIKRFQQ